MKRVSFVAVLSMVVVMVVVLSSEVRVVKAVTCNPTELSPCMAAITSSAPPSSTCCSKVREQRPCLCGYIKDPNLKQYVNSPNARKVVSTCGVSYPQC
ncbi:hypothetical protein LWI29_029614 [Acer saccharum]|uniref:Bifunctional inhibitor/plant lipid transfer protein/seed storage helical domain-containing protein n=1 Tax=Acer saccharum TaxID=4024 RepID=A0AA39SY24_ACESA|nr:hypothetical protein LWI29_029614 [Acer saccharum]KAK1570791.1 hypothetical protein Q3G72_007051 [Acer saccharum]KAK1575344.1 hypothetical protein Q3G72_004635 [Acer saccharum]